jgi:hypothetical protein
MTINKTQLTITDGQALVAEFNKSGLKPGQFCRQKNIAYHIFQYWRDRCKMLNEPKIVNEAKFLPINLVRPTPKSAAIKITINTKITIELANEVNLMQFKKVLEVCMACG